jgi:SAM-dependent methyltransferase
MPPRSLSLWRARWQRLHEPQADALDRIGFRWVRPAVVLAAALTLYCQLLIVRWHAACFHDFNVFKNISLLSCFLGLGIGYGLSERRRVGLASFLPLLAVQALLFALLSWTLLGRRGANHVVEQLIMGSQGRHWYWRLALTGNVFVAAVFTLNALMFVPLGHLAGRLMNRLPPLHGYALNLLGSLAGIAVFWLLSLCWSPPAVWLGVAALGLAPFLTFSRTGAAVAAASLGAILLALGILSDPNEQPYYSPYQLIALRLPEPGRRLSSLTVNHLYYQDICDCSAAAVAAHPETAPIAAYYDLPYRLNAQAGDVLVVGAGTGNDVAAALRHRARSATAVEIDPVVLFLGRRLHPERPYQDPRTEAVLDDARTFLRQTDRRFDTIVYGMLDSHSNLGALSNVRLDSFVYTVEGFRDAVGRLSERGLMVVSFAVLDRRQADRLYAMLSRAYPQRPPRVFRPGTYGGTVFVTGPGLEGVPAVVPGVREATEEYAGAASAEVATDDWPFLYLKERTYPLSYAAMNLVLLAVSGWLVQRRLGLPRLWQAESGTLFFLGAGFMLIETRGITELGLVFGNTWSVVAVVVVGILLMGFAANLWVLLRGPVSPRRAFALLGGGLLLGLAVTRLSSAGVAVPLPRLVLPVVLTLPLFFAGLIFSSLLSGRRHLGPALSANLLGAMLGGLLEYNSMYWGYSSLYPLGMALYALAFCCQARADWKACRVSDGATAGPVPEGEGAGRESGSTLSASHSG